MREQSLFPVAAVMMTAFVCAAAVVIMPGIAAAQDKAPAVKTPRAQPKQRQSVAKSQPVQRPQVAQSPYRELTTRDFAQSRIIVPAQQPRTTADTTPDQRPNFGPNPIPDAAPLKRLSLDETDQYAALESVQFALSEVGDGASYVWHRHNGRISGVIQPQSSFKTATGEVCRVLQVTLASGTRSKTAEGVACRLPSGQWRLEG